MPNDPVRYVRFYFIVSIACLIPKDPDGRRSASSKKGWEQEFLGSMASEIEGKLSQDSFDAGYLDHSSLDPASRLYEAAFAVSKVVAFPLDANSRKREASTRNVIQKSIHDTLKWHYVVQSVAFDYSACRDFVWEVYLEGTLRLEHAITREEISDAGGRIRETIENFNNRVFDTLQPTVDAYPKQTNRRPESGIFEYNLAAAIYPGFSENEVSGALTLIRKDSTADDMARLGIDFVCNPVDDPVERHIEYTREQVEITCLEEGLDVVDVSLEFIDYDGDVYDVHDE